MEKEELSTPLNGKKICANCGSSKVYIRIKTSELVCQRCGFIEKKEEGNGE